MWSPTGKKREVTNSTPVEANSQTDVTAFFSRREGVSGPSVLVCCVSSAMRSPRAVVCLSSVIVWFLSFLSFV